MATPWYQLLLIFVIFTTNFSTRENLNFAWYGPSVLQIIVLSLVNNDMHFTEQI